MDTWSLNKYSVKGLATSPVGARSLQGRYRRGRGTLPGGKLQPIRKNHSAESTTSSLNDDEQQLPSLNNVKALPGITPPPQHVQELDEQMVSAILCGNFKQIPSAPSKVVRIFLSSTFADMQEERNILNKQAFPNLQQFCTELGLDFQTVDMRWGVTDNATNDHLTSVLCMSELQNCQRTSLGPTFVAILGERYGYRPFPTVILANEYETLRDIVISHVSAESVGLMDKWFKKDENAEPVEYCLQPLYTHLKHFNDTSPENADKRSEDRATWWSEFEALQTVFRKASHLAVMSGKLSDERGQVYIRSVTEHEVCNGILNDEDASQSALFYGRQLKESTVSVKDKQASGYIDVIHENNNECKRDEEANQLIEKLKKKVMLKLPSENIKSYVVDWSKKGIDSIVPAHQKYLEKFCEDFMNDVKRLILKNLDAQKASAGKWTDIFNEVATHARFIQNRCNTFHGRRGILSQVESHLKESQGNGSLVIHGDSGNGKTSIMAKIADSCKTWLSPDTVVVARFLGITPNSSRVHSLFLSLIAQLSSACSMPSSIPNDVSIRTLLREFQNFLERISKNHLSKEKPLIIILDSVDQLSSFDEAIKTLWVFKRPPSNVHYILSMVGQVEGMNIIQLLKSQLLVQAKFISVNGLDQEDMDGILDSTLKQNRRRLTESQRDHIMTAFQKCDQALFVKIAIDQALTWKSYSVIGHNDICLGATVERLVNMIINTMEKKYHPLFVKYSLSYLTVVGFDGITERELEDLLSCNDAVLNEVYQYHDPPVEGSIRIPALLWARIRYDIKEYIVEREKHNKTVVSWYHRQFLDTVAKRYGVLYPSMEDKSHADSEEVAEFVTELHAAFTEIYQATDGIKRTIILTGRNKTIEDADRGILPRPLIPTNHRKLCQLPYHMQVLIPLNGVADIKTHVLCNFQWLYTKLKGLPIANVYRDYKQTLVVTHFLSEDNIINKDEVHDIKLVLRTLEMAEPALRVSTDFLAGEIIGRLSHLGETYPFINELVSGAFDWIKEHQSTLVPVYPCLESVNSLSSSQLIGPSWIIGIAEESDLSIFYCHNPPSIQIRDLSGNEIVNEFPAPLVQPKKMQEYVQSTTSGELVFIRNMRHATDNVKTEFTIWSSNSGVKVAELSFDFKINCFVINEQTQTALLGTCDGSVIGVTENQENFILKTGKSGEDISHVDIDTDEGVIMAAGENLYLWDEDSGEIIHTLPMKGSRVSNMQVHKLKKMVVLIAQDELKVVNYAKGKVVAQVTDSRLANTTDMKLILSGSQVICAAFDHGVLIYLTATAKLKKHIPVPESFLHSNRGELGPNCNVLEVDNSEEFVFVGFENGLTGIFHLVSGQLVRELSHGEGVITSLQYHQGKLFTASDNGSVMSWHVEDLLTNFEQEKQQDKEVCSPAADVFPSSELTVMGSCLCNDGKFMVTSHTASLPIKVWDGITGKQLRDIQHNFGGGGPTWLHITVVNGNQILLAKGDVDTEACDTNSEGSKMQKVMMWDLASGDSINFGGDASINCLDCTVSRSNSELAVIQKSSTDSSQFCITAMLYSLNESKELGKTTVDLNDYGTDTLKVFAVGILLDKSTRTVVVQCQDTFGHPPPFFYVFQCNGDTMTTINNKPWIIEDFYHRQPAMMSSSHMITVTQSSVKFWDVEKQVCIGNCEVQSSGDVTSGIVTFKVSDSGDILVTSDNSCCVMLWTTGATFEKIKEIKLESLVNVISFTPDNQHIVTGSDDNMLHTWNCESGMEVNKFFTHRNVTAIHTAQPSKDKLLIQALVDPADTRMILLSGCLVGSESSE